MPAAELLRAYLEGQADLGTDEVVLVHALPKAPKPVASVASASASDGLSPSQPADTGLFATLSAALAAPGAPPPRSGPAARAESAAPPAFANLAAYWAHLAAHPGTAAGDPSAAVTCVVRGTGAAGGPLALVGLEPDSADAAAGLAFQGDAGALLEKMLKAIRLDPQQCYRTNLVKAARPIRAARRDMARLLPWLHAELELTRAPIVLLLGEACAQAVLKTGKPLDELRQEPFRIEGREFAATWHPADLLAREELKRKAWEDLQWLQKRMAAGA
jgi:DNA polymerase